MMHHRSSSSIIYLYPHLVSSTILHYHHITYPSYIIINPENHKTSLVGGHVGNVKVARAAPNNTWAASADDHGKIRVWALQRDDHMLKIEKDTISANDLKWDGESKRIVAGGSGGRNKVVCFTWDTASELGKMGNHVKTVNAVDIRQSRPFRIVSGGEDFKVNMYKGPPFQFELSEKQKNFVNSVRYSPDGSKACAVTSGSNIVVFDGKTHEVLKSSINVFYITKQPIHDINKMAKLSIQDSSIHIQSTFPATFFIITFISIPIAV